MLQDGDTNMFELLGYRIFQRQLLPGPVLDDCCAGWPYCQVRDIGRMALYMVDMELTLASIFCATFA